MVLVIPQNDFYFSYHCCYMFHPFDRTLSMSTGTVIGFFRKNGLKSEAMGDFAVSLEAMVEAESNTGYLAQVKRAVDGKTK